jgi:hypothetical protein
MDYLLLDVDGVLNATLGPFEKVFFANGFKMRVPSGTRRRIEQLEEHYRIIWCTTWQADAPGLLASHFGFGADWPFMPLDLDASCDTIKLPSVRGWLGERLSPGDRFAWIDDDLHDDARDWAASSGYPSLLVSPSPNKGWTRAHVEMLLAFATSEPTEEASVVAVEAGDGNEEPDEDTKQQLEEIFSVLVGNDSEQAEMWIFRLSGTAASRRDWADAILDAAAADPEMPALGEFARVADALVDSPYRRWVIAHLRASPPRHA